MLRVGQQPLKRAFAVDDEGEASLTAPAARARRRAADPDRRRVGAATGRRSAASTARSRRRAIAGVAAWDFSRRMESLEIEDTGPNGLHGRLVNLPTRAMKGAAWTGAERDWKHAPHHYAAIHFHDDDLHDCGWEEDFTLHGAEGPEERRLRHAAALRHASRHHPVLRAARRSASRRRRSSISPRPSPIRSTPISRAACSTSLPPAVADWKAARQQSRRPQGLRPLDLQPSTATARAWPIPRACGRC